MRQPVGVVVGIAPWNAPLILGDRAIASPLAYGNTVVLKASEECPARTPRSSPSARRRHARRRGQPDHQRPRDAAEIVEELVVHPGVRRVNFTGSTRVGRIIAEKAPTTSSATLLELGGKAPLVVLDDADLDAAAAAASFGAFMNPGQICMSTERIVVDRSVADDLGASWPIAPALLTRRPARPGHPGRPRRSTTAPTSAYSS